MRRLLFIVMALLLISAEPVDKTFSQADELSYKEVQEAILALHTSRNGRFLIWNECGKRLRDKEKAKRAAEYTEAIMASIKDVHYRTDFRVDPRIPVAIIFRESSNNECVIGKLETDRLANQLGKVPDKRELYQHVKKWATARSEAKEWCKENGKGDECVEKYIGRHHSHYAGIRGWDIGAAQYRWPSSRLKKKQIVLPSGKVAKTNLGGLFDYKVSIQLLIEDLEQHYRVCSGHVHWKYNRWGKKVERLPVEEAYYVHHHMGSHRWSYKYWKRIQRHLKVIDKVKQVAVAKLFNLKKFFG